MNTINAIAAAKMPRHTLKDKYSLLTDARTKWMSKAQILREMLEDEVIRRMNLMKIGDGTMRDFLDNGVRNMCDDMAVLYEILDFEKVKSVAAFAVLPGNGYVDVPYVDGESDWDQDVVDLSHGQTSALRILLDKNGMPKGRRIVTADIDWNADGIFLAQ